MLHREHAIWLCIHALPSLPILASTVPKNKIHIAVPRSTPHLPTLGLYRQVSVHLHFFSFSSSFYLKIYLDANTFGCQAGSQPLIGEGGIPQKCNPGICPPSYTCQPTSHFGTWQCCSGETIYRKSPKASESSDCDHGSVPINGRCMRRKYYFCSHI